MRNPFNNYFLLGVVIGLSFLSCYGMDNSKNLNVAIYHRDLAAIRMAFEANANVDRSTKKGDTPMHLAVKHLLIDIEIICELLAKNPDLLQCGSDAKNPADLLGNAPDQCLRRLRNQTRNQKKQQDQSFQVQVNARTQQLRESGEIKVQENQLKAAEQEQNMKTSRERNMVKAVRTGNSASCEDYLAMRISPNLCVDDETILHIAARSHPKLVQLLLTHNADPMKKDHYGRSPLYHAIHAQQPECTKILLKAMDSSSHIIRLDNLELGTLVKTTMSHGSKAMQHVLGQYYGADIP